MDRHSPQAWVTAAAPDREREREGGRGWGGEPSCKDCETQALSRRKPSANGLRDDEDHLPLLDR